MTLQLYANEKCSVQIKTIEWDNDLIIKLLNGGKKRLSNTAEAGQVATAIVYLKNEGKNNYAITDVSFHDKRLSISIKKDWLEPNEVTSMIVKFTVPKKVTPQTIVKAGKIEIEGYYVYGDD